MKRKILTVIMALALASAVTACGSTSSDSSKAETSSSSSEVPTVTSSSDVDDAVDAASKAQSKALENSDGVTLDKYNQLKNDMTLDEVRELFGSDGTKESSVKSGDTKAEVYMWTGDKTGSNVQVTFTDGKVSAFAQAGLE